MIGFPFVARAMIAESQDLVWRGQEVEAGMQDPVKKQQMQSASATLVATQEHFRNISDLLAATAQDEQCRMAIQKSGKPSLLSFNSIL